MPLTDVLAFWAVAALLIAVPGPDWAFAIGAGLRGHAVPAALGIVLGYLVMTVAVAAGIGTLVVTVPPALTALTVVGGLYLVGLGAVTAARPAAAPGDGGAPGGRVAAILRGIGVSGLNPKGLLIFVALLPQFTTPGAPWPLAVQIGVLGLVFALTCAAVYPAVGAGAHRLLRARPAVARAVSRTSGLCMIVIGVLLLAEHLWALTSGGGA